MDRNNSMGTTLTDLSYHSEVAKQVVNNYGDDNRNRMGGLDEI